MSDKLGLYKLEHYCSSTKNYVYLVFIEDSVIVNAAIDLELEFSGRYVFPISKAKLITNDIDFIMKFKELGLQIGQHPFNFGEVNASEINGIEIEGLTPKQAIKTIFRITKLKEFHKN